MLFMNAACEDLALESYAKDLGFKISVDFSTSFPSLTSDTYRNSVNVKNIRLPS